MFDITVTFLFPGIFLVPSKVHIPVFLFASFYFSLLSAGIAKSTIRQVLVFFSTYRSGRLVEIRESVSISKSQRSLCISFSWTDSGVYIYHLFVWSNCNLLHNSHWIIFATQTSLVLYSFYANLLRSLMIWLIRLYLHITFICYFVASYLFLLWYNWSLWPCFVLLF